MKCEQLRVENELLRDNMERIALNKNMDNTKFNTVKINEVLKSGERNTDSIEKQPNSRNMSLLLFSLITIRKYKFYFIKQIENMRTENH